MSRVLTLALCATLGLAGCNSNQPSQEDLDRQIEIHIDTARAYINMGEYQRGEDQARRGLSLDPDNFDLKLALARALQMEGSTIKILEAESIYRGLPRDEDYRVCLGYGETLERKGLAFAEAAEAVEAGERPVENIEASVATLTEISQKSWAQSAKMFREGLELQTANTELMSGLARVYSLMGDMREALTWCEATLEIVRNDRAFWKSQLERDNLTTAEDERFHQAKRRLDELEIGLRLLAANIEVEQDHKQKAVVHLGKVIELDPKLAQAYSLRASLLMDLERYEEVVKDLDDFLMRAGLPFEDERVQRAFQLKVEAEAMLIADAESGDA